MSAYDRLRPWTDIESCECEHVEGLLLLQVMLTDNPIHCSNCRREVDPERIELTYREVDSIANWHSTVNALYMLWLDSGEYEAYAKARLIDPKGSVNQEGQMLAQTLSKKLPTKLWYFHDTDDGEPTHCPICKEPLNLDVEWGTGECANCYILI